MPRSIARFLCVASGLGLIGLASATTTAAAPGRQHDAATVRLGYVPRLPTGSRVLGPLDRATLLHVTIALEPRDPAALERFATAVSTPGSSEYRRYITPGQFAARFGATTAQIRRVERSLRAHGLTRVAITSNHLSIRVAAAAGALERGLATTFERLALPGRRTAIVNRLAPRLDAGIASLVQAVVGLSSTTTPRPLFKRPSATRGHARPHVVTGGPQPCATAAFEAPQQSALTADQLASAYQFSSIYQAGDQGQGQTVALYELEPNDPADIAAFQSCYGTHASVSYTQVDGGSGSGPGSGEAALDIEAVIGLAPRANILVYQAPNSNSNAPGAGPYDDFAAIISQDRAKVVSASWGGCEALDGSSNAAAEATLFEEAAAQGQTVLSAAGDSGSEDCFNPTDPNALTEALTAPLAVDDPASQPFVTGVGGTTVAALGPRPTETVWNTGGNALAATGQTNGAGGGGISAIWRIPGYQSGAPAPLNVLRGASPSPCGGGSTLCREVPDVSADADPNTGYLIYWNGTGAAGGGQSAGWQTIGGTSLAAPIWASMIALANALPQCHGTPVGFANPDLYRAAATGYGADFNDVSAGNNDYTGSNSSQYSASGGYDMASGLGTPNASSLGPTLCAGSLRLQNPGSRSTTVKAKVAFQIRAIGTAAGLRFAATGLPAGVTIDSYTGEVAGSPRRIGSSTVTVAARDPFGESTAITFRWIVGGRPTISRASIKRGTLSLTITKGVDAPALARIAVGFPRSFHERAKTVTPRKPAATVKLTARVPKRISGKRVRLTVTVKDALGTTTVLATRARVS